MPPSWKLPVTARALFAGGLLLGAALVPVAAQQAGQTDGQVAVRSDGAVYLLTNGQRRWVATVQISDADLNAYPEGDPLYGGLVPLGSSSTASAPSPAASPAASPATGTPSTTSSTTTSSSSS